MPCSCCCGECDSPCCGTENPVSSGECCGGEWRTGAGTCCADVWQTGSGVCCGGVWQTGSGECCGGVWYTDAGECCEGAWYPDSAPCPEGETYTTWGPDNVCCGCITDETEPPEWCLGPGEPKACCSENPDGFSVCDQIGENVCVAPSSLAVGNDCATGCLGECCVDGESIGPTTQDDCPGCWAGLGSTACLSGCRDPFTNLCCESVTSTGAGVTLTQPRQKRCPPFSETLRVTVTGHTDSPVLVHGTPFGKVGKRCPISHSFLLCWDKFNIEPVPCDTDFIELDVTVCWEEEATDAETLNFSGCDDLTVWLGGCAYDCVTTLLYTGAGHTSNAAIILHGDGIIEANGTGALVLTTNIQALCADTLTLSGDSTEGNEIQAIGDSPTGLEVVKQGSGLWRLAGDSSFTGQLKVLSGTLVIASAVDSGVASPFGDGSSPAPVIGDSGTGVGGTAAMLVEGGLVSGTGGSIDRSILVASLGSGSSQVVILGTTGTGESTIGVANTTDIRLGRSVTLQASDASTAKFSGRWRDGSGNINPVVGYTIGSPGNAGIVQLRSALSASATGVDIVNGTAQLAFSDRIASATPVTIATATLELLASVSQSLDSLEITGQAICEVGSGGTLTVDDLSGSGDLEKEGPGAMVVTGANDLSGEVSITDGSLQIQQIVSGPAGVNTATFTSSTLTVDFSSAPSSGQQFQLLAGSTANTYTPALTNAGGATATYNSLNSTLTIT